MATTEAEVASSLSKQEGSLSMMLRSFNATNLSQPVSSTPEIAIPQYEHNKSIRLAESIPTDDKKYNLSKSDDGVAHSITPPIRIGSASLSHSFDYTPKPAAKIVGTPADFRRHISEEEFNKRNKINEDAADNIETTAPHKNKEPASPRETPLPQTTKPSSSFKFTKVSLKKSATNNNDNNTDANVVYEVKPVEFQRTVGGFHP